MEKKFPHLQNKTVHDFTYDEIHNQLSDEELEYLNNKIVDQHVKEGLYDNARIMDPALPLDPNIPEDYLLGKTIGLFE